MLQLRPTFSESWYRVKDLRPRLRAGAQVSRQYYRGDRWYVVRDPAGNQFHRLSDAAYRFVGLLDGQRTVAECWDLVGGQLEDDAPTQPEIIQILSQLYAANLVETDIPPDATVLLRRHKVQQQRQMQQRLMNILFPRIPIWDPDRFLCRWMPAVRPFLSKFGAILWLVVVGTAVALVAPHWQDLKRYGQEAIAIGQNPLNVVYLYGVFILIKFIHECGHAFATRRFGGEVHEMGIMFLVFVPTPYVDASTAWAFPNKWARIFVGAGGMVIELFVASICAFFWLAFKDSGSLVAHLLFNAMLIASVTTVVFNANPLLRYDGYYILSDYLEIPNLQWKSREYLLGLIKRHVYRIKSTQPLPPPGQRIQLLVYGLLSTVYRIFVGVAIILMVAFQIPILGALMAIGGVLTWLVVPVFKLLKYLMIDPELHRKRGRAWAFCGAVGVAAFALLGLIHFPMSVYAEGVCQPERRDVVHARTSGFVKEIRAKDGDLIKTGDVIAVCDDPDLRLQRELIFAEIEQSRIRLAQAATQDQALREIEQNKLRHYNERLEDVDNRIADLTIKSKIDGRMVAPKLHEMVGAFLPQGQEIAMVATVDKLEIRGVLEQRDAELAIDFEQNPDHQLQTEIRLAGAIDVVLNPTHFTIIQSAQDKLPSSILGIGAGGEVMVDPRDQHGVTPTVPQFELRVKLSNPESRYYPGQRAYLRLKLDNKPLAWQWLRRFYQLLQKRGEEKSKLVG